MTSAAPASNQASPPQNSTPQIANAASPPSKRDLKSWWKGFKLPSKHQDNHEPRAQGIFGVPLRQSITYANVAISLIDENGQSYIYGYVPIVVAKCGVFLKEKATGIEGIFRLSGSEKRIKELKTIFDSPDRYGKGLSWEGYTVHDAANVLRRYLNDLPEPVVPLDLYEKFRDPLRGATKQAVGDAEGPQFVENFDERAAIEKYQKLITELPPLNRQLLLYILDLLAVFAAKSDENRMNSQNLAAIFQPGMLSHPSHAMAPEEYRLNQCVIIFLIENQDHFLIGMQGTAADETTKKEIELGTPNAPPVTPNANRKSGLGRSASNASAGAESVRRHGQIRRNRSVSSRSSRHDGSTTPNSPALTTTPTTGGLTRSNTVPSKKSPAIAGGRFQRHDGSGPNSPARLEPLTQVHPPDTTNRSEQSSLGPSLLGAAAVVAHEHVSTPARSQERLLEVPQEASTPSKDRSLPSIFQRSPTADSGDRRQPNKLRKKRIPGSLNPSAQSSSASLSHGPPNAVSPSFEMANPMEQPHIAEHRNHEHHQPAPIAPAPAAAPAATTDQSHRAEDRLYEVPEHHQVEHQQENQLPPPMMQHNSDASLEATPRASQIHPHSSNLHPENTLKAKKSPPTSLHSSFNEGSDAEHGIDEMSTSTVDVNDKERKRRWRLSRTKKDDNGLPLNSGLTSPRMIIGSNDNADISTSSIGSSSKPRKSFTEEAFDPSVLGVDQHGSFDLSKENRDEPKGPIGWIRNKYREAKESAEQRRNKSPPADRPLISSGIMTRGKSLDIKRDAPKESEKQTPPPPQSSMTPAPVPTAAAAAAAAAGVPTVGAVPTTVPATEPSVQQLQAVPEAQQQEREAEQQQPKPEVEFQPQLQVQTQAQPPQSQPGQQTQTRSEPQPETRPQSQPEVQPESKPSTREPVEPKAEPLPPQPEPAKPETPTQ